MRQGARAASSGRCPRLWAALVAILAASCLLTTSLDGLEGPPLSPDGGAPDGGAGAGGAGSEAGSDGGNADDRIILDGTGDVGDGAKGPFPVVTQIGGVLRGIAVNDKDIYWVQTDPAAGVVHASKGGGGQSSFFHMTPHAFDVAVDADYVYWSTGKGATGNEVLRKPIGSTMQQNDEVVLFPGAGETLYLALGSGGRIYVTGSDVVTVGSSVDAGTSYVPYPSQPGAAGIALSGTNLFWSVTAGIVRGVETGQPSVERVYTSALGEVAGIATDAQEIFWIVPDGAVRALPIDNPGAAPPREVCHASVDTKDAEVDARPDGAGDPATVDVAVDDQWVYFTEPAVPRISKCLKR